MGKITDAELKSIGDIRQEITQIVYALGEIEYQKAVLDLSSEEVKNRMKEARSKEAKLFNDLKTKYGNVNINIETGEF